MEKILEILFVIGFFWAVWFLGSIILGTAKGAKYVAEDFLKKMKERIPKIDQPTEEKDRQKDPIVKKDADFIS